MSAVLGMTGIVVDTPPWPTQAGLMDTSFCPRTQDLLESFFATGRIRPKGWGQAWPLGPCLQRTGMIAQEDTQAMEDG
jgi:hypothetical protein